MKKKMRQKMIGILLFMCLLCLAGCGKKEETKYTYQIYYVNKTGTKVIPTEYGTNTEKDDVETLLPELLEQLKNITGKPECVPPLAGTFQVMNYTLTEGLLNLDFDEKYIGQDPIMEVLNRAAIVRTLTQLENVQTVSFSVLGAPIADLQGVPIGPMMAESFIDNTGTEFSTYEKATLRLYFANESGDELVEVNRTVILDKNNSMEKTVMDELIKGPDTEGVYKAWPTINPETVIQTVTAKDGVCYVNLDKTFLTPANAVTAEVTVYSIVNSMAELSNINKVQISVDGETDIMYREKMDLTSFFERNLDIVQKTE